MNKITLELASTNELDEILKIQKSAFKKLFMKYHDLDTSPYNETIETILFRFNMRSSYYFFIMDENKKIGFIRILFNEKNNQARISPIAILPEYENKGYGKIAMTTIENKFYKVKEWHLDTITQEKKLIGFYLNQGYQLMPEHKAIKEGMDISVFKKIIV